MQLFRFISSLIVFAGVLVLVFLTWRQLNTTVLLEALTIIGLGPWLLIGFLQLMTLVITAFQWRILLLHSRTSLRIAQLLAMNLYGTFYETITPMAKSGGEWMKYRYLEKAGLSSPQALNLIVTQKAHSMTIFVGILSLCTLFVLSGSIDFVLVPALLASMLTLGILVLILYVLNNRVSKLKNAFSRCKVSTLLSLLIAFVMWGFYPIKGYVLALFLGVPISFFAMILIAMIAYAVAQLPVSLGGLGTFEVTFVAAAVAFGVSLENAIVLGVLYRFVTFWFPFTVAGAMVFLRRLRYRRWLYVSS